jgi:undecaprenyl-phosphate 4-deoxy-4-formamido-L-arabinose transferase
MSIPQLSVVIPVYNEEDGLQTLFDRLYPALDKLGISYEILFINDGSRDRSAAILREQFQQRPDVTRVILFNGNFGQHMAIMAGFEQSRGDAGCRFAESAGRNSQAAGQDGRGLRLHRLDTHATQR